jgi:hypothetical protein
MLTLLMFVALPAAAGPWRGLAERAAASEADLGIRSARFETPLQLPSVTRLLDDPARGYDEALAWGDQLAAGSSVSAALSLAEDLLASPRAAASEPEEPAAIECLELPERLRLPVAGLEREVRAASAAVRRAAGVYTVQERQRLLSAFGGVVRHEPLARVTKEDVELAARYDHQAVVAAARRLAENVERRLSALTPQPGGPWKCGEAVVYGTGDDAHAAEPAALIIDLGGKNTWEGAFAHGDGDARVVVDLGTDLIFKSTEPAFGSALFGIGLLYAPMPGKKDLSAADLSLGAGLFGAGGVEISGGSGTIRGGNFTQGAGAFGAGVLRVFGQSTEARADFAGQGFGFTRGAGFFMHKGAGLRAECGLTHPDPRDPQAYLSMCQGAGDGPRAYAAGGVGLAAVSGSSLSLRGSYFAQGSGYWHAFGGLYVRGDGNFAQSRRYAQGAGVHAGAGMLSWRGSDGRILNWGVGPAFGWDYGVGMLSLRGDRNGLRAEWASGSGDVNGRSLAVIEGDGNALRLPDWGLATFKRTAPGYALSRIAGTGNALSSGGTEYLRAGGFDAVLSPWGAARGEGELALRSEAAVAVATEAWPTPDRSAAAARESEASRRALAEAASLPENEKIGRWLALASGMALDGAAASASVESLLRLPRAQAAGVVSALSVEAFDEALWVRLVASAAGGAAAARAARELKTAHGRRRVLLSDLLRFGGAEAAVPAALSLLDEKDWRLRRAGASQLAAALGAEGGEEPGRLEFLRQSVELARSSFTAGGPEEAAAFAAFGYKRLTDLYAALAVDPALSGDDRLRLLAAAGDPFDTVKPPALRVYAELLRRRAGLYARALDDERARAWSLRPRARERLRRALSDPDADVRAAVLAALGSLGESQDAARMSRALAEGPAVVREAAAYGLARLGEAGAAELAARLQDASAATRRLAALAAAQNVHEPAARLLLQAFSDADEGVRLAAVGALSAVQAPYGPALRRAAAPELDRLAVSDPSPSVAASAARQLGRLGR